MFIQVSQKSSLCHAAHRKANISNCLLARVFKNYYFASRAFSPITMLGVECSSSLAPGLERSTCFVARGETADQEQKSEPSSEDSPKLSAMLQKFLQNNVVSASEAPHKKKKSNKAPDIIRTWFWPQAGLLDFRPVYSGEDQLEHRNTRSLTEKPSTESHL